MLKNDEALEHNDKLVKELGLKITELQSIHAELRQMLAHSPAVIYTLKIDGEKVVPLVVSENIERLLGVVPTATDYSWWFERLHPDDRDRAVTTLTNAAQRGGYMMEYRMRHQDGTYRWIEDNNRVARGADGQPMEMVGVWTDINERKNSERLALRSQRLEAIGTLVGGVAHDLNNALAPIMMGVELLRLEYPTQTQIIDMFQTSAKRGADMVRQLLTFARGAEGDRVSIQIVHVVDEMHAMMKGSFPKNIRLVVKRAPKLPTVLGDVTQMHQILLNLCVNARDAMPNGGTLTLEAKHMEVDAVYASAIPDAKPGSFVLLRVQDSGTGIPPAVIDRIFEPFFTTKGPGKGTGLGLSTVLGIVKGHDGFMQVYSQPGQGSTFTVYLPVDHKDGDTGFITKGETSFRGQGETILFVDDDLPVRNMARMVLRRLNFTPLVATDGADGLIKGAERRTELRAIVTDLHMPHMDGLAFIGAMRRILPEIPVIVASGRLDETELAELKALNVTARLDKPFTEGQLADALKNALVPK